jgi:hypothetical protein
LPALLAHDFLHVSRIRVKSLTLRLLISYTGCPRRKGKNFGRVFLMIKYTNITPKKLYPKLNGYGDNGQKSLKL